MPEIYAHDYMLKTTRSDGAGNAWAEDFSVKQNIATGDKVYFGIVPGGTTVYTATANKTGLTLKLVSRVDQTEIAFTAGTPAHCKTDHDLIATATAAVAGGVTVIVTGKAVGIA